MKNSRIALTLALLASLGLTGCGGDNDDDNDNAPTGSTLDVPETYAFPSRFSSVSSVAYPGQVARQVLIADLRSLIDNGLGDRIDTTPSEVDTQAEVVAILESHYDGGIDTLAGNELALTTTPPTVQDTYGDISSNKNLTGKIAGNDDVTDHVDWDAGDFVGWSAASPEALVRGWFDTIGDNVATEASGSLRQATVDGTTFNLEHYLTEDGLHLGQLVQKFLLGAVAFSQAADDYLDDDVDGKGLMTDNVSAADSGASPFTELEHQWDEGFGYFGAARDYNAYTDDDVASQPYRDSDGNGFIDLQSEYIFDLAGYAAKRDRSSQTGTTFSEDIFNAFLRGRAIISNAGGELTSEEMSDLQAQRDIIVENWEKVLAANVVHYINSTLADMDAWSTSPGAGTFGDLAAHWSEMKAFALGLQFNPRMTLTDTQYSDLHDLMGEAPVLPGETGFSDYRADLLEARDILENAYGFAGSDVADW
ncbi:DUF4856 domain-containing protein [Ectothiorhodospiraceae bacterium WFHF3C12]|nr:DUF4856 domain-containing protein [Ectothiorhodospiraceae bacterium WFHF3C12]